MSFLNATVQPYSGNGLCCYTNSLVSVLGPGAPSTAVSQPITAQVQTRDGGRIGQEIGGPLAICLPQGLQQARIVAVFLQNRLTARVPQLRELGIGVPIPVVLALGVV